MKLINVSGVFTPFPVLETRRLILRELSAADAPALLGFFGDPQVAQYLDIATLTSLDEVEDILSSAASVREQRTGIRWAITLKGQDIPVGTCGFHRWDNTRFRTKIGYELAATYWRQGLMGEALRAILAFGFEHMVLHRVEALCDPLNKASISLLASLGFQQVGILRDYQCYTDDFIHWLS